MAISGKNLAELPRLFIDRSVGSEYLGKIKYTHN